MIIAMILILLFSVILHEVAHGATAYKYGDDTAYLLGRLSLNPVKHIDPIGTIAVPLVCYLMNWPIFGWAKPVPVNTYRLRDVKNSMGKIALAGPAANTAIAVFALILFKIFVMFNPVGTPVFMRYYEVFSYAVLINILLAVFNMVPIPPLDGSKVLAWALPDEAASKYMSLNRYGMMLIIAFIFLGGVELLVLPVVQFILKIFSSIL